MRQRGGPRGPRNARVGVEYACAYDGAAWNTVLARVVTHALVGAKRGKGLEVVKWCDSEAAALRRKAGAARIPIWAELAVVPVTAGARTTAERRP